MRKYVVLGGLLVFSIALLAFVSFEVNNGSILPQAAGTDASLSLNLPTGTVTTNQTFTIDINLSNPGLQPIAVVDVVNLTYNPQLLQVIDADTNPANGTQIQVGTITQLSNILANRVDTVDAAQSKIIFSAAIPIGSTIPFSSSTGTLATITFKALKPSVAPANVDFNFSLTDPIKELNAKVINYTTQASILGSATGGSYTINSPTFTINLSLQFQGITDPGSYSKTVSLIIFPKNSPAWSPRTDCGQAESPCEYRKNNITLQANSNTIFTGSVIITAADWADAMLGESYDFHLGSNNYLYSGIINMMLTDGVTISPAETLRGGNFLGSDTDLKINTGDQTLLQGIYTQSNTTYDLNGDGVILGEEYAIMNANWGGIGR